MKKLIYSIFLLIIFWIYNISFWENIKTNSWEIINEINDIENNTITPDELNIKYKKNISINEDFKIDLSHTKEILKERFPDQEILFEWNIKWETTKNSYIFEKKFNRYWDEEINLNIYLKKLDEKKLIINLKLDLFIYEKSIAFIFDKNITNNDINDFINNIAKKSWVYIYNLWIYKEKEIENINLIEKIAKYKQLYKNTSNYIWIWWEKEFLFSIISKLNIQNNNEKINLVLISPFNTRIILNYLNNLVSDKSNIDNIILIDSSLRYQLITTPLNINNLEKSLKNNKYDYLKLNTKNSIDNYFFISKFINNLSNKGYSTTSIYIIIIIPFLFTMISFFKHFIWLSPVWTLIPIFLSILFIKVWIVISSIILLLLLISNLFISKIVNKYTLLYTPKISFIITINFIIFIIFINLLSSYFITLNLSDSLYIILFIIISEKLITIIISKEFKEYRSNLINTFFIALAWFIFFNLDIIKTIILSYPEIIIFLIPINFIIWRFTWLRVTEYFRFKEIIKNIEEE